ncbi:MAG: hypothetical protein JW940_12435 [Polyangiaceae bacterium]|nr:hypothetical protein [Polyangiaceae bacterium]
MTRCALVPLVIGALGAGTTTACASAPRPAVMQEMASARTSPATMEARRWAPQEYADAELLQTRAERAYRAGDIESAQILSEHALVAYDRATVLARLLRAERRHADAAQRLSEAQKELESLERQRQALDVEARDLEMRAKVIRDAEPLRASEPSTPDRELARRRAALAVASRARLLCVAAGLLDRKSPAVETLKSLDTLDSSTKTGAAGGALDEARRLESQCLSQLASIRRPATATHPRAASADALLSELTQSGGFFAFRDDRGVVVVLRNVFARDQLTPAAQQFLQRLGVVAKRYPDYPVLAVFHGAGPSASSREAQALALSLTQAGAAHVTTEVVANAQPVVDPKLPGAAGHNQRVEIIFVAPSM